MVSVSCNQPGVHFAGLYIVMDPKPNINPTLNPNPIPLPPTISLTLTLITIEGPSKMYLWLIATYHQPT
jgi:hypothetical protein